MIKDRIAPVMLLLVFAAGLAGCEPEVGSERWCERMDETPRADWSANDALEYARHCVID